MHSVLVFGKCFTKTFDSTAQISLIRNNSIELLDMFTDVHSELVIKRRFFRFINLKEKTSFGIPATGILKKLEVDGLNFENFCGQVYKNEVNKLKCTSPKSEILSIKNIIYK